MKKILFLLMLLTSCFTASIAQNMQEVVYLKNGSVIRGLIIEQIPGVSLKIQTSDGNIFAYPISDVKSITKEVTKNTFGYSMNNNTGNERGYKGFVDLGYTFGIGDWGIDRLELSTSYGYQFNPYIFVGAGVAANYYFDAECFGLPIFVHVRGNIFDNKISPYIDFKIGYSPLEDVKGMYMVPSVGCKIKSFNVSIGYVMQKVEYYYYDSYYFIEGSENCGGLSLKVGYEF